MKELGFAGEMTKLISPDDLSGFELGRVITEHKERYLVQTDTGVFTAEITGNLRYSARSREDFPAVGDWVKLIVTDTETALIQGILPRISKLERQAVGKYGEIQIIATNIDHAFIVQSVGQDFNLKRMERYLTLCHSSGIKPLILLTKTDLISDEEVKNLVEVIRNRIKEIPVIPISSKTLSGFDELRRSLKEFKTYCFLGSSGVGKSSIVNQLSGVEIQKINSISSITNKGKHTTSHRELVILPNKSIVIDTPGMREVGMTDNTKNL